MRSLYSAPTGGVSISPRVWAAAAALGLLGIAGCGGVAGPELSRVTGRVVMKGEPVAGALVVFTPEIKGAAGATGQTDAEGRYELRYAQGQAGAPMGPNRVEVTVGGISDDPEKPAPVPKVYAVPGGKTVAGEANEFDIDLSQLGKPRI